MSSSAPFNEAARLEALYQYSIVNTEPEDKFDDLVRLASQICRTPIAVISFVDKDRVWFKAKLGLKVNEIPRDVAFCADAILRKDFLTVNNAREDPRFKTRPLVSFEPYVQFYTGVPLITPAGHALGTLCVMDTIPRTLTQEQQESLGMLARQVTLLLEERRGRPDVAFSYHDSVTNLPNQELFKDRLQQALVLSRRNEEMLAVMLVSLDRFKTINDTLGYVTSDQLLREVAERVAACV